MLSPLFLPDSDDSVLCIIFKSSRVKRLILCISTVICHLPIALASTGYNHTVMPAVSTFVHLYYITYLTHCPLRSHFVRPFYASVLVCTGNRRIPVSAELLAYKEKRQVSVVLKSARNGGSDHLRNFESPCYYCLSGS